MIVDYKHPKYRRIWTQAGDQKYNGAYYYSKEIVSNIIPLVNTDRNWLTINVPGLKLKGTSKKAPAKITWYYGHGYQYRSMGAINYGGSRSRRWNASVLVTAPDFYAENIIFENSLYNYKICKL